MTSEIDSELLSQLFLADEDVLPQIKAVVDDLCKDISNNSHNLTPEELPFYSAIVEVLRDNHKKMIPHNEGKSRVPRLKGFDAGAFRTAFHKVEDLINCEVGDVSKRERFRFYRLIAKCTYEYLKGNVKQIKTIQDLNEVKDVIYNHVNDKDMKNFSVKALEKAQAGLNGRRPSIGITGMLEGLQYAEDALEASFPGYLKSGFLHIIVKPEDVEWP